MILDRICRSWCYSPSVYRVCCVSSGKARRLYSYLLWCHSELYNLLPQPVEHQRRRQHVRSTTAKDSFKGNIIKKQYQRFLKKTNTFLHEVKLFSFFFFFCEAALFAKLHQCQKHDEAQISCFGWGHRTQKSHVG